MQDLSCDSRLQACHDCDLLQHIPNHQSKRFYCVRCEALLYDGRPGGLDNALALNLAAMVFFVLANSFPVVGIQSGGNTVFASIPGVADALHAQNMNLVALVVLATTIVFPGLDLMCTCSLLLLAKWRQMSSALAWLFRLRSAIKPWSMIEIFVLGALVAIVKLGSIASVNPGIGLWSLCAFIVLSALASYAFDPVEFWNEIKR